MSAATPAISIHNDTELKQALEQLDPVQKRIVGALFVGNVESLTTDDRVYRAIEKAQDINATAEELEDTFKSLKRVMIDSRARCGADSDWGEQAAHFVTRAANAVIAPQGNTPTLESLWQVVQSCRIARNCALIAVHDASDNPEAETQYHILSGFLNANN